jgi:glycerate dehydrogenase
MKMVVLDGYTLNPGDLSWDGIKQFGELTIYDRTPLHLIEERVKGCEVVITNKTPLDREMIQKSPQLKLIAVLATGYNVVDTVAAREFGIGVCNVPSYGTDAVAQFVFALLLGLAHKVETHHKTVKDGKWTNHTDFCYWETPTFELYGKTMGLIGMGKIGIRTAEIARAFGMKVLAYDLQVNRELENEDLQFVDLDELYEKSDVISLHVPLFESTKHMINQHSISKMKKGVLLINTSRGALINEDDLLSALESGRIGAAAVDVVSVEPIQEDNPLLQAPNILITPHIAWAPVEARSRLMNTVSENIAAYLKNIPLNIIN